MYMEVIEGTLEIDLEEVEKGMEYPQEDWNYQMVNSDDWSAVILHTIVLLKKCALVLQGISIPGQITH